VLEQNNNYQVLISAHLTKSMQQLLLHCLHISQFCHYLIHIREVEASISFLVFTITR
jgi:hypothetical protein